MEDHSDLDIEYFWVVVLASIGYVIICGMLSFGNLWTMVGAIAGSWMAYGISMGRLAAGRDKPIE